MRSDGGQATIDYVALVAVLAIVFGLALGVAPAGAAGIVNAVTGQIRLALCRVGGGPCADPRSKPCTVASTRELHHFAVSALLLRIDHDRSVLREEMSDGTVRLTVARSAAFGVTFGAGAAARAAVGGRRLGAGGELLAAAQGTLGRAKVYVARDEQEADAFIRALRDGREPAPPREVQYEGGVRALGEAGLGGVAIEGLSGTALGVRRDRETGDTTLTLNAGAAGWGAITTAFGLAGTADRATTFGLTLDRDRRPTELSASAGGTIAAGAALPLALKRALRGGTGGASVGALDGRRWELNARLSLLDPAVRATWERVRRDPTSVAAIRALGEAIRDRAHLDVRTYRTSATASGAAAGVAGGVRFAGEYDHVVDEARLLSASARPPAGLWERRIDCVPAPAA
ncbi:MAG: hypothetical protein Q8K79_09490 [Solirubrobacteraceae bacterium]|nr:hypothetical protein [Solirubrobacteraceae bacterium]